MVKDLTTGKPLKLILGFSVPVILGMLLQQLYNLVDTAIVGQALGSKALAAVGSTGPVSFLLVGFCMGVCSGFAIPVANRFGANDEEGLRRFVANTVWLSIVVATVVMTFSLVFCRQILTWMLTPAEIIDDAELYIRIIFMGIPTVFLYNLTGGIIRSLGDSRTPLYFLMVAAVLNVGLDAFFVLVMHTGVPGAAWATVIAQGVSGLLCLVYMIKKFPILHIRPNEWKLSPVLCGKLCGIGIPMGLQYSVTAIGAVVLQTATNTLGPDAVAAVTACNTLCRVMCCPLDGGGSAMATWAGQNVGARKLDRVRSGLWTAILLGWGYSVIAILVALLFGENLVRLFVHADNVEIIKNAALCFTWNMAFYAFLTLVNDIRFTIQGMGYSVFAILSGVFEMIARALTGIVLVPYFGFLGVCMGSPLAWVMADIFLVPAFFTVYHFMKKKQNTSVETTIPQTNE